MLPLKTIRSLFYDIQTPSDESIKDTAIHKNYIKAILNKYPVLKTKEIFIFYSNAYGKKFVNWQESSKNIHFVDIELNYLHYHLIDDHLNVNGHKYIANSFKDILESLR